MDRVELTELLSEYQQIPIDNADNVLNELRFLIMMRTKEKYERVHFHFSGNYFKIISLKYRQSFRTRRGQ